MADSAAPSSTAASTPSRADRSVLNGGGTFSYAVNTNNLVVACFAALLTLLLLAFTIGVMYICTKLRRQRVGEEGATGWAHDSFRRGSTGAAASTAAMYRQTGGALSWDGSESLRRQDLAAALAMDRPAFFNRPTDARLNFAAGVGGGGGGGSGGGGGVKGGTGTAGDVSGGGGLVRAALPQVSQQRQQQPNDQAYDDLQMRRLALSGSFANEHAHDGCSDGSVSSGNPDHYQSEEYLDVLVTK